MANEEVRVGADVTAILSAMERMQASVKSATNSVKGDLQVLGAAAAKLSQTGDLEKFFATLDRRSGKSQAIADVATQLRQVGDTMAANTRTADRYADSLDRVKRASGAAPGATQANARDAAARAALLGPGSGAISPGAAQANARAINAANAQADSARKLAEAQTAAARRIAQASAAAAGYGGGRGGGGGGLGGSRSPFDDGSFFNRLKAGFDHGRGENSNAFQVGQVFRTSLLYSSAFIALRGIKDALTQSVQESVKFQMAISELAAATGRSRDEAKNLATALGEEANKYGFSGSVGAQVGTRAIGVFRGLESGQGTQDAIARTATSAITKQAFLSGKDVTELTANVAALAQAFGLGAESIGRITDTTTFFEKQFGIAIGSLSESLPAIASLFAQGGFSIEEAAGFTAAVQSRQAGTPAAASGLLSQILTREGEGTVQAIYDSLGVVGATMKDRFAALAEILPDLSEAQQGQISSAFGKGRSQSASIALFQELQRVTDLAQRSKLGVGQGGSVGLAQQQAGIRLNDIGGQLAQFAGALKQFQTELGSSGLLDVLGLLAISVRELLDTTNNFLEVWNTIPGVVKAAAAAIVTMTIAARLNAGSAIVGGLGRLRMPAAGDAMIRNIRSVSGGGAAGGGPAAGLFGLTRGATAGIAIGATVLAIGAVKGSFDSVSASAQKAADALTLVGSTDTGDLESIQSSRAAIATAIADREKNASFIADRALGGVTGAAADRTRDLNRLRGEDALLKKIQDTLTAQGKGPVDPRAGGSFGDLSVEAQNAGLERLTKRGFSAAEQFELLSKAIDGSTKSAADAAAFFDRNLTAQQAAAESRGVLTGLDFGPGTDFPLPKRGGGNALSFAGDNILETVRRLRGKDTANYGDIQNDLAKSFPGTQEREAAFAQALDRMLADGKVENKEATGEADRFVEQFFGQTIGQLSTKYGPAQVQAVVGAYKLALAKDLIARTSKLNPGATEGGADQLSQEFLQKQNLLELNQSAIDEARLQGDAGSGALKTALQNRIALLQYLINNNLATDSDALNEQELTRILQEQDSAANRPAQIAAAAAAARAASTKDPIDDMTAATKQAAADLAAATANRKQDEVAYFKALQNYNASKLSEAEAIKNAANSFDDAQYRSNLRRLTLDLTNPLTVAKEDTRLAQAKLNQDLGRFRSGGYDKEERAQLAEDRLGVKDARSSQEQVAFSQRLQDIQTRNQLGQLSDQAALRLAEAEKTRLEHIKKRTFQQQQQLNEVTGFIQGLNDELQGQFNLGDITLPTQYDARRYVQGIMAPASGGPVSGNSTTFVFNGYDTDELVTKVSLIVGDGGTYSVT